MNKREKINTIDLFAGCGGLMDGFEQTKLYNTIACVEWEKAPCENIEKRLKDKWKYHDAHKKVLRFDIQRTKELINGWQDDEYGSSDGLDSLVEKQGHVDLIIGGPPCQAYSIAGRIRDENGMNDDYRNYLFESYLKVVNYYKPKAIVFENVPGMLSARPNGVKIVDVIKKRFAETGYEIMGDLKEAIIDFTEYGVPQKRKRVIILGLNKDVYGDKAKELLNSFYTVVLPSSKLKKKVTVRDSIADLPKLCPLEQDIIIDKRKFSHSLPNPMVLNHLPRWQSKRDIDVFKMLTSDIEQGINAYVTVDALKKLYTRLTGKKSNIHKYHVIRWDDQSNTIPAHLYKDGLRHIHPDSTQARTITVREAARLQTFADDYEFIGGQMAQYKMIGNAVPPIFAKSLAKSVYNLLFNQLRQ